MKGLALLIFNIEPHLNTAGSEHLTDVEAASKIASIYGLHDETFIEDVGGFMKIFGEYRLVK